MLNIQNFQNKNYDLQMIFTKLTIFKKKKKNFSKKKSCFFCSRGHPSPENAVMKHLSLAVQKGVDQVSRIASRRPSRRQSVVLTDPPINQLEREPGANFLTVP